MSVGGEKGQWLVPIRISLSDWPLTLGCAARLTGACAIPSDAGEEYADRGGGPRGPTVAAGCLEASV
eukprot:3725255-Prymnesium_polylepis.1